MKPPTDHLPKWQKGQPSPNQYIVLPPSDAQFVGVISAISRAAVYTVQRNTLAVESAETKQQTL